jgi:hypothetical protein
MGLHKARQRQAAIRHRRPKNRRRAVFCFRFLSAQALGGAASGPAATQLWRHDGFLL